MASTIVTSDHDAIVSEIDIAAPAGRVFRGICDAETVRRRPPEFDVFEMDLRVGGKWRLHLRVPKPDRGGLYLAPGSPRLRRRMARYATGNQDICGKRAPEGINDHNDR